jgi:ubiquinone/menaquinone biosynthesis C-methylase UbiE
VSYEEQAESWIALTRRPSEAYWTFREAFFELVPEPGNGAVDLGCGEGRVTRDLRERGHRVVGVDMAPTLVAAARELDPEGEYLVADAAALPFEDGSFDLAVAYNSLMDVDDLDGTVREASRVLRSGGRFCVCVTHPVNDAGVFEHDEEPGSAFHVQVYRGRRQYDLTLTRDGVTMRFVSWCYPLEGYTRPLEEAGFLIEAIREPGADRSSIVPWGEKRLRIPNFLLIRAVKPA